ncbi:MAG: alpha-amylase family glycosyl hydrolase, partial [Bacteroidota bacterium]
FKGNLHSQGAKNHIYAVAAKWLDPNKDGDPSDGLDGYRLDVAAEVPMGFWIDFRKEVKKINPEAYLIGEIWWKSWPDELMFPHNFLQGDMFDAIMNYRWFRPARHFFADAPEVMKPSEFVIALKDKLRDIDTTRLQSMMNLLASHDAERISTSIYNNGRYKYQVKPYDNHDYKIDKPDEKTRTIQKMILIHQFTFIGSPHIWYGDEVGMWGADDPDTRKPMVWADITYEDESTHPFNKERRTDKVRQDTVLLNYYKKLIQIRKAYPSLVYGNIVFSLADDENNTLAYIRNYQGQEIVAAFNKSTEQKTLKISVKKNGTYKNALNESEVFEAREGVLTIELIGEKAIILVN